MQILGGEKLKWHSLCDIDYYFYPAKMH